jgi:hypothetical protein
VTGTIAEQWGVLRSQLDEIDELVRRILLGEVRRSRTPHQPKQAKEAGHET